MLTTSQENFISLPLKFMGHMISGREVSPHMRSVSRQRHLLSF